MVKLIKRKKKGGFGDGYNVDDKLECVYLKDKEKENDVYIVKKGATISQINSLDNDNIIFDEYESSKLLLHNAILINGDVYNILLYI